MIVEAFVNHVPHTVIFLAFMRVNDVITGIDTFNMIEFVTREFRLK